MRGIKRGVTRFMIIFLLLAIISPIAYAELQLTINAKLNDYNADFIARTNANANSAYNDGYDIVVYDLPDNYSQFYSTNGSTKLSVDTWSNTSISRTINLTYLTSNHESGTLNLSWFISPEFGFAYLTDYGYDSSYTLQNSSEINMKTDSSYATDVNGSNRYLQLRITTDLCYAGMAGSNTVADPCMITSCTQLQNMSMDLSGNYALSNNINCSETSTWNWDGSQYLGFKPVGNESVSFTGTLQGNNNTISKLFIQRPATDYVGLFGSIDEGAIIGLNLTEANITGHSFVGGITGYILKGSINYSRVSGVFNSTMDVNAALGGLAGYIHNSTVIGVVVNATFFNNGRYTGGITGYAYYSTIIQSASSGYIRSPSLAAGGLVGSLDYSTILESYSTVTVNLTDSGVGGLAGLAFESSISDSYATGRINGSNQVGGLVGVSTSQINNSYATGNVNGNANVGGLIGDLQGGVVRNSFSTGNVTGAASIGGLTGSHGGTIINGYWYNNSENPSDCYSGGNSGCTSESQIDYFTGDVNYEEPMSYWDFFETWSEIDSDYPVLTWQGIGTDVLSRIYVYNLTELYSDGTLKIFEFFIKNNDTKTIRNISWVLYTGEENITSDYTLTLAQNESISVIVQYNYTQTKEYTVNATATKGNSQDSKIIIIDVEDIELNNLALLNKTSTNAIFEFSITNYLANPLTDVSWIFDTDDNYVINSTINLTLQPDESIFVYVEYNYSTVGTYYPNATAINGSLQDSANISIII